ncbi:MAG: biopolymer transporter ExbD [Candidatus Hydrogenedentota bacterium]
MKFRERRSRRLAVQLNLTPLVDVVLLLLLFFMLSSTFVVHSSIEIEMPNAEGATDLEQTGLSVTLAHGEGGPGNAGRIYVDNAEVSTIEELSRVLSQKAAENPNVNLLIRTDARTDAGRLVEVLGLAASSGITHLSVGARPPAETP